MEKEDGFMKEEKNNVLSILSSAKSAIKARDTFKLKELSNHVIHSASIYQDPNSITLAVLVYALGKVIEKGDIPLANWKLFTKSCSENLDRAKSAMKMDNVEEFQGCLSNIRKDITKLAGPMKNYIDDVFRKAMINKASKVYAHGISQAKTAELLGISSWELASFAGQTDIPDINLNITQDIRTRLNRASKLFSEK